MFGLVMGSGRARMGDGNAPGLLGQAARQFPVDVVLVNLDPTPDAMLRLIHNQMS